MIQVYKIQNGSNKWCGPAALSAITGLSTKDTAAMLRRLTGRKQITYIPTGDLIRALNAYGFTASINMLKDKCTLGAWVKNVSSRHKDNVYLVMAGYHFMVVKGRQVICNLSGGDFVHVDDHPKKRAFMTEYYLLGKAKNAPVLVTPEPKKIDQTKKEEAIDLVNLKLVCKMFKLTLTLPNVTTHSTYWVEPPEELFARESEDPHDDCHYRDTPGEALEIALDYAKLVQEKRNKQ